MGRRIGRTLPAGQAESYTYDGNGNIHTHTDFNGKTTTYAYDAGNRMRSKAPDASFHEPTVTYTYNATTGVRTNMSDAVGGTEYFTDGQGRVTEERGFGRDNIYTYDGVGNLATIGGTGGTTYSYDALERLSKIVDPNMGTFMYGLLPA